MSETLSSDEIDGQPSYEVVNVKAKAMYECEFDHVPIGQRPRWESQPLEYRVGWLNRAARKLRHV